VPSLVIDSSIASAWCFPDERTDYTDAVLSAVTAPVEAAVPQLWAYEVRNAVLMGLRRRRVTEVGAQRFLDSIRRLRIRLVDPISYDSIFHLAVRHRLTYYDAAYLDLALREALPLASLDDALRAAARDCDLELFRS